MLAELVERDTNENTRVVGIVSIVVDGAGAADGFRESASTTTAGVEVELGGLIGAGEAAALFSPPPR